MPDDGGGFMSDRVERKKRNAEDRTFLHAFATPMALLKYSIAKLEAEAALLHSDAPQGSGFEAELKCQLAISRAKDAVAKMEQIHGDFKLAIYDREIQDGDDPLEFSQNRRA